MAKAESEYELRLKQRAELNELSEKQLSLEAELGLTDEMERARGLNFYPLGLGGEDVSPDEYFADEHDGRRRRIRKVYFAVPEMAKRRQLIELALETSRKVAQHADDDLRIAQRLVARAKASTTKQPWLWAAVIAAGCVAIGYSFFQLTGALAGAVAGFFLGQGTIASSRNETTAALARAESDLRDLQKSRYIDSITPDLFNLLEGLTGEEDREFGSDSAHWNVRQHEQKQKSQPLV